jgi:hypothetical protein
MRRFEYKLTRLDVETIDHNERPGIGLQSAGQEGWELVAVIPASRNYFGEISATAGDVVWLFFKRELEPEE